jgi:hypothetical protein
MKSILIASLNRVINLDQVTDAIFTPAHDIDFSEEPGVKQIVHADAVLDLTMTSVEDKIISGNDGDFQGVVAVSRVISVEGSEAERLWSFLIGIRHHPVKRSE